jgi:hypothetical protein
VEISSSLTHPTTGNQIDGWAPKQVLWSLVKLPGENNLLHVFNTHMQVVSLLFILSLHSLSSFSLFILSLVHCLSLVRSPSFSLFQASYYDAPSDTSDMARAKQVSELAAFVKEKVYGEETGPRFPALICGDFNLDALDHKHQVAAAVCLKCIRLTVWICRVLILLITFGCWIFSLGSSTRPQTALWCVTWRMRRWASIL